MGSVDLVYDAEREEEVARKRILEPSAPGIVRFKREFRAIEQLRHEGLVALYELDEDALGTYFTMEYVPGEALTSYCQQRGFGAQDLSAASRVQATESVAVTGTAPVEGGAVAQTRGPWSTEAASQVPVSRPIPTGGPLRARCDWGRLEASLAQLLDALAFLHESGVVHCDLKPSNVLVRADGVLKVLDFGVAAEVRGPLDPGAHATAGTIGYMAPEQIRGEPPTPAADLYALGAMLFELVSGVRPFEGTVPEVLRAHLHATAPWLGDVVVGVPPAYAAACAALLRKRGEDRPGIEALQAMLGLASRASSAHAPTGDVALVGRETVQEALRMRLGATREGAFGVVALAGPTGAGKTSLLEWLAREAARDGMRVLRGRGRPTERVAFNAVDGAVDDLARALATPALAGVRRARRAALEAASAAFPVLCPDDFAGGPRASRAQAFDGLVAVLAEVAAAGGLLVVIDDLQWADADSLALLDAVAEASPARVAIFATLRDDVGDNAALGWLRRTPAASLAPVAPLDEASVARIIERVAHASGAAPDEATVRRLVVEAAGRPYLAELAGRWLGRAAPSGRGPSGFAPRTSTAGLAPLARAALAAIVVAEGWTRTGDLAGALDVRMGALEDALGDLERDGLVRRAGARGAASTVDVYHDLVRRDALDQLGDAAVIAAHRAFATWFAARPEVAPYRLVRHLLGAGDEVQAARLARDAAAIAEAHAAYGFAAEMYAVALLHAGAHGEGGDRRELLRGRARALEQVGAYHEAAVCWRAVADESADREEASDARLREAQALLGASEVVRGYESLNAALTASGQRALGTHGLADAWAIVSFLSGPSKRPRRRGVAPSAEARSRGERDVRTAQFVTYFDPLAGLRLLRRARTSADASGDDEIAAWCDLLFATSALFASGTRGTVALAARYQASARERLEGVRESLAGAIPDVVALGDYVTGLTALREAAWTTAVDALERAIALVERKAMTGSHGHLYLLVTRAEVEVWRQDMLAHELQHRRLRAAARGTSDGAMRFQLAFGDATVALGRGDFAATTAIVERLDREWTSDVPTAQRLLIDLGMLRARTLGDDPVAARVAAARLLRDNARFRPLRTMYASAVASLCAMAEVAALRAGDREASARSVRRFVSVARQAPPLGVGGAIRALAYLEEHEGRPERALALLEEAEAEALARGQRIDVAVARHERGRRLGGDAGDALIRDAASIAQAAGFSARLLDVESRV